MICTPQKLMTCLGASVLIAASRLDDVVEHDRGRHIVMCTAVTGAPRSLTIIGCKSGEGAAATCWTSVIGSTRRATRHAMAMIWHLRRGQRHDLRAANRTERRNIDA